MGGPAVSGILESLLADRFTRHVSLLVMDHASRLDLASYEDPVFYDKLERARVQATDRIAMIQAIGAVGQQIVAAVSLSLGILWFSPWLLVVLVLAVVPAFLGESHFAFLGYAQNIRQTPVRRQLDYLRVLGASKESAKELRLFGLSGFLYGEYERLSNGSTTKTCGWPVAGFGRELRCRCSARPVITARMPMSFIVPLPATLTWGTLQFLAGAIAGASSNIQSVFSTFSSIADQSLFLTDLVEFLRVAQRFAPSRTPCPPRARFEMASSSKRSRFPYPGGRRADPRRPGFPARTWRAHRPNRGERAGKTTLVKLLTRLVRSHGRADSARWRRPARVQHRRYSYPDRRYLSRLHALRNDGPREHRSGPHRAAQDGAVRRAAHKSLADEVIRNCRRATTNFLGCASRAVWTSPAGVAEDRPGARLFS